MSHTRSARKSDGSFDVTVTDWQGTQVHVATYPTMGEADSACRHWERLVTLGGGTIQPTPSFDDIDLDDLLRELES